MTLTAMQVAKAAPGTKDYKLADERGMYLLVKPNGSKLWRLKARLAGKEKLVALGSYPDVKLGDARDRRDEARALIAKGLDPVAQKRSAAAVSAGAEIVDENSFGAIRLKWLAEREAEYKRGDLAEITMTKTRLYCARLAPLDPMPVRTITTRDVFAVLEAIAAEGRSEAVKRARLHAAQIFGWAAMRGLVDADPVSPIKGAFKPPKSTPRAAILNPRRFGELLRAIDGYGGEVTTKAGLQMLALTFVRVNELRLMRWRDVDLDGALWRSPAENRKGLQKRKKSLLVPLAPQAVAVLRSLHDYSGSGEYAFPAAFGKSTVVSENTWANALRRLGFPREEMSCHGFRAFASSSLHEMGFPPRAIELQLSHEDSGGAVSAAYNRAEFLAERTKMMTAWADHLDRLRAGKKLIGLVA